MTKLNRAIVLWAPFALAFAQLGGSAVASDTESSWVYQRFDYTAIKDWLPSAQAGNAEAQANLGVLYEKGWGVTQDSVRAYAWYSLAAQTNGDFAKRRERIAAKMTAAQIAQAQALAAKCRASNYQDCD